MTRLLSQGYTINRLSNTFNKFYGRHTDSVGQYKKMSVKCFAVVPVKMINFFQICQSWIDKIRWDGGCHAWGRSRLLYLVITSISCDVPSTACVINWQSIFVNNLDLSNFLLESGLPYFVFHLSVSCWSILWVLQDVTVLIHEHYEPAFWIVFTCYGKRMTVKKLSLILIFYQNFANIPWKN